MDSEEETHMQIFARYGAVLVIAISLTLAAAIPLHAQTFTLLHSFSGTDGSYPYAGLVQSTGGSLFGTTSSGGAFSGGTVFKMSTGGTLTNIYSFCALSSCADGTDPRDPLVQALNGSLYGTSFGGGPFSSPGTIFKMTTSGTLSTLYTFCALSSCTDGDTPFGGLVQALNGSLYGTTYGGGAHANGTIFDIKTSGGALTTLYNFCSLNGCGDGISPQATLIQGTDNSFYGTTFDGGAFSYYGTVFKITTGGVLTTLHSFDGTDGDEPVGGLVQAKDGNYYGTTQTDGANGYGTVFKISSGGTFTTLYNFCTMLSCADGSTPVAGLIQGSDGNLYGTTFGGGAHNEGTVFSIPITGGTVTTLHSFDGSDGNQPWGALVQDTNGTFYGTTYSGGASNLGTVFSLSVGLAPFVKVRPPAAKVGVVVDILGTKLTGATSVTFNGTPAVSYTVNSSSEITATVPVGATTGPVVVVAPSGTYSTYPNFRVTK
jgi:uncharacterized repeat protein (TIGR03803 family)